MSLGRNFFGYWLPVAVWMLIIFTASSDTHSAHHSSRIIEPILRWLFPHLADATVSHVVLLVRKCAHVAEYAVLALLVWRALRGPARPDSHPWRWAHAGLALLATTLYASSDEIHQLFVPHREGRFADVLIDASGATLGLLGLWLFGKWRKWW